MSERLGNRPTTRDELILPLWPRPATASYRLLPSIEVLGEIDTNLHAKFQACFPPGVIDISNGRIEVSDPRKDTVSREVLRHAEFEGKVRLGRVRDHFICKHIPPICVSILF